MSTMTREEHLAWCKERALEYTSMGDARQAFTSMLSDLHKHPETDPDPLVMRVGLEILMSGRGTANDEMVRFIEGFN